MNEVPFTAADMLRNPLVIETVSWPVASAPGTTLITFQIPEIFVAYNNYHKQQLGIFAFAKMSPRLIFQLNSTKFHQGRAIAFYDPFDVMGSPLGFKPSSIYNATGQPNVLLDASLSNSGEIKIPFEHLVSYLPTNSSDPYPPMGTVGLMVLNQLKSTASDNVTIRVLLMCDDIELHVPIAPHDPLLTAEFRSKIVDEAVNVGKSALGTASNFATGNFGASAQSASTAFKSVSNILKEFNLDKPTEVVPQVSTMSAVGDVTNMIGCDSSVRLDSQQVAGYYDNQYYSTMPAEEMEIKHVIRTKMLAQVLNWTSAQPPGTVLAQIPIHPRYAHTVPVTKQTQVYQEISPTFLSYMATFFRFWRGSIAYRLDFISTQFHTGRLAVVFVPSDDVAVPTGDLNLLSNYPMEVFDLHEQKSFDFSSPFASTTARKLIFYPEAYLVPQDHIDDTNIIGYYYIVVYNALVSPETVAANIDINLYIGAGEDFELDVPIGSPFHSFMPPVTEPVIDGAEFRSMVDPLPLRSEDRSGGPMHGKGTQLIENLNSFSNQVKDVRDLARRFCYMQTAQLAFAPTTTPDVPWSLQTDAPVPVTDGFAARFIVPVSPGIRVSPTNNYTTLFESRTLNFADIVSKLYTFWSGSMRYKFITPNTRNIGCVASLKYAVCADGLGYPAFLDDLGLDPLTVTSFPTYVTNTSQNLNMNVECPYFTEYNQLLTSDPFPAGTEVRSSRFTQPNYLQFAAKTYDTSVFPGGTAAPVLNVKVMSAIGDDFVFSFLVAPPNLYYFLPQV